MTRSGRIAYSFGSAVFILVLLVLTITGPGRAEPAQSGSPVQTQSITVASFNVEHFGWAGQYLKNLEVLATELAKYDFVALQEVMKLSGTCQTQRCYSCSGSLCHLDRLVSTLDSVTSLVWAYQAEGPFSHGTEIEYYVFLYRTDKISYLNQRGTASDFGIPFEVRPPMYAKFRSGSFDFYAVDYHAPSDTPLPDVSKLCEVLKRLQALDPYERDVILFGDFNLVNLPLSDCGFERLVMKPTKGPNSIDTILIDDRFTGHELSGEADTDDAPVLSGVSDHALVWAKFWTSVPDDD